MNAIFSKFSLWVIFILVLLLTGAIVSFVSLFRDFGRLRESIELASESEQLDAFRQQQRLIEQLQSDLHGATESVRISAGYAESIRESTERALGIAQLSDAEFARLRETVGGAGATIQDLIRTQQRIIDIASRLEENHRILEAELRNFYRQAD